MLTPQEVSTHSFSKASFGGYNMAMVDEFLDELTDDYTALYKENAALKAKLKVLVEKVEEYRATEDSMRATLLTAQRMADSIVKEAEQKRDQMMTQAEIDAKMKITRLKNETAANEERLRQSQAELEKFSAAIRAVCDKEIQLLTELPQRPVELPVEEAEEAFTTTAEIRKEMLDEDNPLYLGTLEALARVFVKQEAYEKAIELYQEKNDLNFEETPQEQMAAANNLLAIANCYRLSGVEEKAAAYFAEAEAKQKRSGLPMDETYEKRRGLYLRQKMEHAMPPKPKKGGDIRKELEYYSALALSIRNKEGEGQSFAKVLLKTAALHAKLGNQRDTETLLDRVLSIGAKEGIFTTSFGRLCDRVGRIYAEAGSKNKAEATLRQAYQIQTMTEKCMTGQGQALLLRLLQEKGDEKAYFAVKNAGKLE